MGTMRQKVAVVLLVVTLAFHHVMAQSSTMMPESTTQSAATGTTTAGPTQSAATGTTTAEPTQSSATGTTTAEPTQSAATGTATAGPTQSAATGTATAGPTQSAATGTTTAGPTQSAATGTTTAGPTQSAAPAITGGITTPAVTTAAMSTATTTTPAAAATTTTTTTTTTTATPTTTTTTATTTTRPPGRPAPVIALQAVVLIVFEQALLNPSSTAFQTQATSIQNGCDAIYRRQFRNRFRRTIVRSFRLVRSRADRVETDLDLEFDENSAQPLPSVFDVVDTLREGLENPPPGVNLTVDPASIMVTSAPKSAGLPQFSTNETFTADLLNSSSSAFLSRVARIKSELEPFFVEVLQPDFISLTPLSFSNGSIVHQTNITVTANGTFPNAAQIILIIRRAVASGNVSLPIISINGIAISAAEVSSKVNLLSACGLALLSLAVARPW